MKLVAPTTNVDAYLELEWLASEPYTRFVYEDEPQARAIARFSYEHDAEFSPPYGLLAVDDGERVLGMIATLDGDELRRSRGAAAMALVRGRMIDRDSPVRERMLLASDALLDVAADDYYLSRIAVAPDARGRGVATWLMARYEELAREKGKRRLVLEVSTIHPAAIRLYEHSEMQHIGEHRVSDPTTGRELTYVHMARHL